MKLQAKPIVRMGEAVTYKAPITRHTPVEQLQEQLRDLRTKAGLSQMDVAERLGCSQRAICYWETQARKIDWRVMVRLLSIYGVRIEVVK